MSKLEKEVKVTRKSRSNNNGSSTKSNDAVSEDKPKNSRRRRRRPVKSEPEVQESEVIETQAEVVSDTTTASSSSSNDYKSIDNEAVQTAIKRIEDAGEEVTLVSIVDELFNIYDLGKIDDDQYDEAKKALGL